VVISGKKYRAGNVSKHMGDVNRRVEEKAKYPLEYRYFSPLNAEAPLSPGTSKALHDTVCTMGPEVRVCKVKTCDDMAQTFTT